jgi:hypothetical protein
MAALTIRWGFRNNEQKPSRARSWVESFGARSLDLLWIISCCFKSRFLAITARLPLGLISLARDRFTGLNGIFRVMELSIITFGSSDTY